MPTASSCLGFAVDCGTLWKGAGVAIMGIILFIGSVYLLLSAILGRTMGYLVLMVSLTGWMAIQSSLWLFGFWSQGIETPTNLGPRGSEPAWIALEASPNSTSDRYEVFSTYPDRTVGATGRGRHRRHPERRAARSPRSWPSRRTRSWAWPRPTRPPSPARSSRSIRSTSRRPRTARPARGGAVALQRRRPAVDRVAVPRLRERAPLLLHVPARLDHPVPVHLPFLDRAEKKRKEFLTGGGAPAWYGPA